MSAAAARRSFAVMRPGARTPEELETLFEDAFVVRDRAAIAALFEDGAVLVTGATAGAARGGEAIARAATALWRADLTYLADPQRVLQARDTALVVAQHGDQRRAARRGRHVALRDLAAGIGVDHRPNRSGHDERDDTPALSATASTADEGEAIWWFDCLAEIKATPPTPAGS